MNPKIHIACLLFLAFGLVVGAEIISHDKRRGTEENNPVLQDASYKKNMENLRIVIVAPASGGDDKESSHGQTDELRLEEIKKALYQNDAPFIWALRGGYGSSRLMDDLLVMPKPPNPKILIGYSDITALHLLWDRWGWKSIHGAMPYELHYAEKDPQNFSLLAEVLSGKRKTLFYAGLTSLNKQANSGVVVKGEILGGNLTILSTSIGTKWQIRSKDKIIFIEDVNMSGHRVDRTLTHLKQAGVFKEAKAILLGSFSPDDGDMKDALQRLADEVDIPVFQATIFGHERINYPLVFGCPAIISPVSNGDYRLEIDLSKLMDGISANK